MPLRAGELSLHHTALVHCSPCNDNDDRRMGFGISFVPAHVRPLGPVRPSALLVRGEDRYGHFLKETRLETPMSPEARAAHAEAVRLFRLRQDQGFTKAAE
jgi:non-haem Fe2+, alpha-ketoglutarate-dependent halogenase